MSEFRKRMRRHLLAAGAFGGALAAERHSLQFDGVGDLAYSPGGATGVGSGQLGWTLVTKTLGRASGPTKGIACVYDNAAFPDGLIDGVYAGTTGTKRVWADGYLGSASSGQYSVQPTDETATGQQVYAVAHRDTATRRADLYLVKAGATLATAGMDMTAGGAARTPLHVGVGTLLATGHVSAGAYYSATNLIALALVRGLATEAELQAYSLASDARAVWNSARLWGYWPVSGAVGSSVPNLGSGTVVPLTLVGPVASELVAL